MKAVLSLMLSLCLIGSSFAQSNFREGYIITNSNDTVYGWVDFLLDQQNMQFVNFKPANDSIIQKYLPGDILGYRLINEGKFYISRKININEAGEKLVFLEFLVQGLKNLYYYRDDLDCFLVENTDGRLIALTKKPDYIDNYRVKEDFKYRGILNYVFKDYESIRKKTEKADFSKRSMIELTKEYHDNVCEDGTACIIFENDYKKKFLEFEYSVYGGIQLHRMLLDFYLKNQISSVYFNSIMPEMGGQIAIYSPRFSTSFGLFVELSYSNQNSVKDFFIDDTYTTTYVMCKYNANRLSGAIGLKYLFRTGNKFRPVLEAGFYESARISPKFNVEAYVTDKSTGETRLDLYTNSFFYEKCRDAYVVAFQLDYLLENKNYIFAKLGYWKTFPITGLYNIVSRTEEAFQLKFGYIF